MKITERNKQIRELWEQGVPVADIAEKFNLNKRWIYDLAYKYGMCRPKFTAKCVYPNLKKWMWDNDLSIKDLEKMTSITHATLCGCFQGKSCTKYTIDALIKVTGMTYEEMFYREDV